MGKKPAEKETTKKIPKKESAIKKEKKKSVSKPHRKKEKPTACKVSGCKRPYRAKGYCRIHYKKWRHGQYGKTRYKCCKENECFKPMALNKHGYCEKHYAEKYIKGVSETPKTEVVKKEELKEQITA